MFYKCFQAQLLYIESRTVTETRWSEAPGNCLTLVKEPRPSGAPLLLLATILTQTNAKKAGVDIMLDKVISENLFFVLTTSFLPSRQLHCCTKPPGSENRFEGSSMKSEGAFC